MKTTTATIALSALAACMLGVLNATDGHAQVEKAAAVQSRKGVPLEALGQGTERELVVEKDVSPPLSVLPPAGTSELAWMTSISDVVLLVRVQAIEPTVTNEQDWITSQVSALVLDVLKEPAAGGIHEGASVTFAQDGGAMVINGRRIRAELPYARGFSVGRTYLLFATAGEAPGELIVGPESTFELQPNSQLASLKTRGTPSVESEIPLEIARQRIRSTAVAPPELGPSNPMELAVALANARVPAGIVIPDTALASYRTTFPGAQVSAEVLNAGLVETVTRFNTHLQAERRGQVWLLQVQDVPADIANRLSSQRYLASTVKSSASHAVFNFLAGLLQETEVTGVVGAGSLPDETCPLQAPVELGAGPTSIVTMLNETVRQAPGLVWFVTYDAALEQMAIGVVCPGGQYTKMLLR